MEKRTSPGGFEIVVPGWLAERLAVRCDPSGGDRAQLEFVLELARENVRRQSGGPFAAAVFESHSGKLLAAGVNVVEAAGQSLAHAEILALALAQSRIGTYDLGGPSRPVCTLVSSSQPCLMCLGALLWSGVRKLVFSASRRDVQEILGFDEGPQLGTWRRELRRRGIAVCGPLLRRRGSEVLRAYRENGGRIYGGRQGSAGHD